MMNMCCSCHIQCYTCSWSALGSGSGCLASDEASSGGEASGPSPPLGVSSGVGERGWGALTRAVTFSLKKTLSNICIQHNNMLLDHASG